MAFLGIDLGGTKLAFALFSTEGFILHKEVHELNGRTGKQVGGLIADQISTFLHSDQFKNDKITSVGISVPGISHKKNNTVWAPNIPGWEAYPLYDEIKAITNALPLMIESDRTCYILGEMWKGAAQGCKNAVFLAIGTGIGAGIVVDGHVLNGANGIAGSAGWMVMEGDFKEAYKSCGCLECHASGNGIARMAQNIIQERKRYNGVFKNKPVEKITSQDVFTAYEVGDWIAKKVVNAAIVYWGRAIANMVSLLNPEKIILGGGVFGPAQRFIPVIREEAFKWAQPISMKNVSIDVSALGSDAGIYGAGFLALEATKLDHQ